MKTVSNFIRRIKSTKIFKYFVLVTLAFMVYRILRYIVRYIREKRKLQMDGKDKQSIISPNPRPNSAYPAHRPNSGKPNTPSQWVKPEINQPAIKDSVTNSKNMRLNTFNSENTYNTNIELDWERELRLKEEALELERRMQELEEHRNGGFHDPINR